MNTTQIQLTKLLGSKEVSFGCLFQSIDRISRLIGKDYEREGGYRMIDDGENTFTGLLGENIGHPATLSDFHFWMNKNGEFIPRFDQSTNYITFHKDPKPKTIPYDSSKELLEQSEETLKQIIELISNNQ